MSKPAVVKKTGALGQQTAARDHPGEERAEDGVQPQRLGEPGTGEADGDQEGQPEARALRTEARLHPRTDAGRRGRGRGHQCEEQACLEGDAGRRAHAAATLATEGQHAGEDQQRGGVRQQRPGQQHVGDPGVEQPQVGEDARLGRQ